MTSPARKKLQSRTAKQRRIDELTTQLAQADQLITQQKEIIKRLAAKNDQANQDLRKAVEANSERETEILNMKKANSERILSDQGLILRLKAEINLFQEKLRSSKWQCFFWHRTVCQRIKALGDMIP